jgi:hypothetical protein
MKRTIIAAGVLMSTLWLALAGCQHGPAAASGEVSLRLLGGSLFCGRSESTPVVRQAGDAVAYFRLQAAHHLEGAAAPDFSRETAVLAALGQRPTMGYRMEPPADRVSVRDGIAIVQITVRNPPADALVGQAVTSPCLLLAIERQGVSLLRVEDQDGDILGQVRLD